MAEILTEEGKADFVALADSIYSQLSRIQEEGIKAHHVAIHPMDWQKIVLHSLIPTFQFFPGDGKAMKFFGLYVYLSAEVPIGKPVVGAVLP